MTDRRRGGVLGSGAVPKSPPRPSAAPLELERQVGRYTIRAGDVVRIVGLGHARVRIGKDEFRGFVVRGFRGDEVECFGSQTPKRAPAIRTFTVDRIREKVNR